MMRGIVMGAAALMCAAMPGLGGVVLAQTYDVVIRNGRIVDGTGNPWFGGDVAIKDGRIVRIGSLAGATAKREIDATGLVVAPGFIDLHTHSDMTVVVDGLAQSKVRQGVTLDVLGESTTVAPLDNLPPMKSGDVTSDWTTFTGYFDRIRRQGVSMNLISHIASEQVRISAAGYSTAPATPAQLAKMRELVARSMEEGAWGLVLRFESGGPRFPDEVIEMAKVVARYGGNVTSHLGSEGFEQDKELDFMMRLAREAKVPIHIFHYKIRGRDNWGKQQHYIDRINAARAEGIDVTVNEYPYTAMNHGWSAFFPVWAREKGPAAFATMLKDPAVRARIKTDANFKAWVHEHGGWEGIVYARATYPPHAKFQGKRVDEIARMEGDTDPADTCIRLMAEAGGNIGGIFFAMSEDNVRAVMRQPWTAIASDAGAENLQARGFPHPRTFGTNPRVLGLYVREAGVLGLEDAVRKMSGFPAQILGLTDRGLVRQGFWADLVLFDPKTVADTATFEQPKSYPTGIPYVLVNGTLVVDRGEHTGARPGVPVLGRGAKAAN